MTDEYYNDLPTFWDCPIENLNHEDLALELKLQKFLRNEIKGRWYCLNKASKEKRFSRIREDKIDFLEMYIKLLEGFINQIEDLMNGKVDHNIKDPSMRVKDLRNKAGKARARKRWLQQASELDGTGISWDRQKFMTLARDRGYMTEEGIVYAVGKEIGFDRKSTRLLLNTGKFTWGQVLCIGVLFQMNPKEFCDIFLSGYFIDYFGEYIASYRNIDKSHLLKKAVLYRGEPVDYADTADETEDEADTAEEADQT